MKEDVIYRLKEFIEEEARSCSMDSDFVEIAYTRQSPSKLGYALALNRDFGCITPLYVYRMLGGAVSLEKIEQVMSHGGFFMRD